MRLIYFAKLLFSLGMCFFLCGCQQSSDNPRKVIAEAISKRQTRFSESMRLYEFGLKQYRASNLDQAENYLQKAVTQDERNSHAWMALGLVEFKKDRLFDAAYAFHKASRIEPSRYEPLYDIGILYETIGRYDQAIEAYEKALHLAPNQVEVMENLARCYIKTNQKPERIKELIDKAILSEERPQWWDWLKEQSILLTNKSKNNET